MTQIVLERIKGDNGAIVEVIRVLVADHSSNITSYY